MTFYRCPNDNGFGNARCAKTPQWTKEVGENEPLFTDALCELDKETCGNYQKIEEVVDLKAPWLEKPNFVETTTTKAGTETKVGKGEKPKVKSAKVKKLEAEMAQKSMF